MPASRVISENPVDKIILSNGYGEGKWKENELCDIEKKFFLKKDAWITDD